MDYPENFGTVQFAIMTIRKRIKTEGISTKHHTVDIPFSLYTIVVYFLNRVLHRYLEFPRIHVLLVLLQSHLRLMLEMNQGNC